MQASTDVAVDNIERIRTVIRDVDETQAGIAAAVAEQRSTTAEIGNSARNSAAGARDIRGAIEAIAAGTRATSEASSGMDAAATDLAAGASRLRAAATAFQR
jgi:methyl-accepting chemotaxis protein